MVRRSAGLGERHHKIMDFLVDFQEENGYSPSIRQIGESIGVKSTSLVDYYLTQLAKNGYIERDNHISRSIRILQGGHKPPFSGAANILSLPYCGLIAAGEPLPVPEPDTVVDPEDPEACVQIARSLLPPRENPEGLYALRVKGDSMIDAMINDGDMVIMRRARDARNGEMVAVWLDDTNETTLKYFFKDRNGIRLVPANPTMQPIPISKERSKHLTVMGKVVMVIRQLSAAV